MFSPLTCMIINLIHVLLIDCSCASVHEWVLPVRNMISHNLLILDLKAFFFKKKKRKKKKRPKRKEWQSGRASLSLEPVSRRPPSSAIYTPPHAPLTLFLRAFLSSPDQKCACAAAVGSQRLIRCLAFQTNRPGHSGEHVEMDFMKLFGTVIAVFLHPGSASRLNGERDKNPNSAAATLLRLGSPPPPPFKHE